MGVPQRDVTEFRAFVLPTTARVDVWQDLLDHYWRRLEMETGHILEQNTYTVGCVCMHIVHIHTYVCMFVNVHACTYVCTYVYTYKLWFTCT